MCGIAGLVGILASANRDAIAEALSTMVETVSHRGPDAYGLWIDSNNPIGLGHRRLSIVDLSSAGAQPMASASQRWMLSYNGEIYNSPAIGAKLSGFSPRGHSDTEVLVEAIDRWGVERTLQECNGMFAFAAWDTHTRTLWLGRDRYGQKPLYYGRSGDHMVFASELQAIDSAPGAALDVDPLAVHEFLRLGHVPGTLAILQGISKLPPAHIVTYKLGDESFGEPYPYWSALEVAQAAQDGPKVADADALEEVEHLLADAVNLRMRSDVPIGVFLSGGIDSTTVAALAQQTNETNIRTFTVKNTDDSGYDESSYAAQAAKHLGTDHIELPVSISDSIELVPDLGSIYDEPFADSSQIPTYLVSKKAREYVTVVLGGDGGDEIFAGYNRHVWLSRFSNAAGRAPAIATRMAAKALRKPTTAQWETAMKVVPARARMRMPANKAAKVANLLDSQSSTALGAVTDLWETVPMANPVTAPVHPDTDVGLSPLRNLLLADITNYLPNDILVKVDRASMAVSLEARAPFLDYRLWDLSCRLGETQLVHGRKGKMVIREIAARHVPREIFDRPKTGFGIPLAAWLRSDLRPWAEELLSPANIEKVGLLDPKPIRELWDLHQSGAQDGEQTLWGPLMLQAWSLARAERLS